MGGKSILSYRPDFQSRKSRYIRMLETHINEGRVDNDMIPYLLRMNAIPWMYTSSSCQGHTDRKHKFVPAILFCIDIPDELFVSFVHSLKLFQTKKICVQSLYPSRFKQEYYISLDTYRWKEDLESFVTSLESYVVPPEKFSEG